MRKGNTQNRRGNRRAAQRAPQNLIIPHPPQIIPQITHRQRMRFTATTAQTNGSNPITFRNLLDTINFATSAVAAYALFDQVRVNMVEIWAAPVQGNAPAQVAVEFSGQTTGQAGDGRVYSDTSMGIEPAHVRCAPSRMSLAALWQATSANTAFQLTCPVAAVIDVDLSYRTVQSDVPALVQVVPAGATTGQLYYRGLDGAAIAATQLPPVTPGPTD